MKKESDYKEKFSLEYAYLNKGAKYVAGVDEVGRGPLAGPVVCCAVVMPLDESAWVYGVDDSKKLSEKTRERLAEEIKKTAVSYCLFQLEADEIDRINILQATRFAMENAVKGLKVSPDVVLVDGNNTHLDFEKDGKTPLAEYVIKGDAKSYTVGCASIVAKVYRDNLMREYAEKYPVYGFEKHKGYGTQAHIRAIKEYGPCSIHRKTFIKKLSEE